MDEGGSPHLPLSIHGVQPALVRCRPVLRNEAVPPVLERSRRGRARGVAHQGPELGLRSQRAAEVLLDALLHVRRAEAVVGHREHHPGLLVVEMWAFFFYLASSNGKLLVMVIFFTWQIFYQVAKTQNMANKF